MMDFGRDLDYASAMQQIATLEVEDQLNALLDLVEQGEDVLITRRGKPVARLVPPKAKAQEPDAEQTGPVYISGQALIDALQACPVEDFEFAFPGIRSPVREITL